ncbi:MAG: class I lanthipeptide [Bacteroidota bacterium]
MKKKSISNNLKLTKSIVAELSDKKQQKVLGGSSITLNPLDCTMSMYCAP